MTEITGTLTNNGKLTIREAIQFTGKSESTIYRYVRKGKIKPVKVKAGNFHVTVFKKDELTKVFNISDSPVSQPFIDNDSPDSQTVIHSNSSASHMVITDSQLKNVIEEILLTRQSQLMKPMEEHALYLVGELKNEVKHLQAEKEALRQESEFLREQIKALPGPAELEKKESIILLLQKEKEDLNTIQKEKDTRHMVEQQKQIQELKEKEQKIKDLEELHRTEMEQALKQAEEKQMEISEAWKKELEEAKKPWWKFW
jgi:predicted DNA-binding transcriptional regulator AlpA